MTLSLRSMLFLVLTQCLILNLNGQSDLSEEEIRVVELNNQISKIVYKDRELADSLARKAIRLAAQIEFVNGEAKASRHLGLINLLGGDLIESKKHYLRNLNLSLASSDRAWQSKAYLLLTEVTKRQGDDLNTLAYLSEAEKLSEGSQDRKTKGRIYVGLGNYYRQAKDWDEAESYYNKALEVRLDLEDSSGLFNTYQVLGLLFSNQGVFDKAKDNYLKAQNYIQNRTRPQNLAALYSNLGSTYLETQLYDSARYYYRNTFDQYVKSGNKYSQALTLNNLSTLSFTLKQYNQANKHAFKGVALAREVNAPRLLSSLYYNLSDNYQALGNYERSFHYYKLSDSIDFEITNEEKNKQLAQLEVKFETAQKDKEIAQQNLDLAEADTQRKLLFAGLVILLLIVGFTYGLLRRKRKSNEALQLQKSLVEKREKEKALLLRELHHRVKNNFQIVSSLLNLQYYDTEDKETAAAIKSGQARVEAMSMIHRELYQSENITTIEMQDYITHLIDNTAYFFDYDSDEFDTDLTVDQQPLGVKYAIPLGVIINELITNSFKHAFRTVKRPLLGLSLSINEPSQQVSLSLWDNGPGLPDRSDIQETSFGLELIRDLVSQLKGSFSIEGNEGSKFVINFPYAITEAHVES